MFNVIICDDNNHDRDKILKIIDKFMSGKKNRLY